MTKFDRVKLLACIGIAIQLSGQKAGAEPEEKTLLSSAAAKVSAEELLGGLDLDPPTDPLLTLTAATPETVFTPKSGKQFAFSIVPQAYDSLGNETYSIGLSVNPGFLLFDEDTTVDQLFKGGELEHARLLSRFNLSAAAIRTAGETGYEQYGVGLSFIHDEKNPFLNFEDFDRCLPDSSESSGITNQQILLITKAFSSAGLHEDQYKDIMSRTYGSVRQSSFNSKKLESELIDEGASASSAKIVTEAAIQAHQLVFRNGVNVITEYSSHVKNCAKDVSRWNRPVYSLGVAGYHTEFNSGGSKDGYGLWASVSQPVKENGQVIFSARMYEDLAWSGKINGADVVDTADGRGLGLRYVHQISKARRSNSLFGATTRGFVEAGYFEEEIGSLKDKYWQAGIGAEIAVGNGTFLQFVVGDTRGSEVDRSGYLSAQVKWSLSSTGAR